jgi:hypothetical protein
VGSSFWILTSGFLGSVFPRKKLLERHFLWGLARKCARTLRGEARVGERLRHERRIVTLALGLARRIAIVDP